MTISRETHAQERFLEFFKTNECRRLIQRMALTGKRSIVLDFMELTLADSDLANKLYAQPDVYLQHAEDALLEQLQTEDRDYFERLKGKKLNVRLKSLPDKTQLREISADNVEKLVSLDALVVRAGSVKPLITRAAWVCREGHPNFETQKDRILLRRPERCREPDCRSDIFEIRPENSDYVNYQELRVQERPEDLPPGQLPRYLEAFALDDFVDVARPGDRVIVTGIVRARPEVIPGKGLLLRLFNISVEVNYLETLGKEIETIDISPDDEKKIKEIAKNEFVHRDIVNSIAPSIYGHEDIKEAVMYLLFSGVPKTTPEGISIRGDIHTLIVGDPGTAKSQMLRYVAKVSPRGLYTSGRGTTAAGLTAAVVREKTGGMVLEAGALVLADKGVAAVDEIDKMRDEDRIAMHEMMEQQTVSIAKGGIIATLNARSSIIAAANPKLGRYEDRLPVTENINIPIVILSRFDLIFIEKDRPQKSMDERLSEHILNVHRESGTFGTVPIESDLLRKYIAYARSRVKPKLTDEAIKRLRDYYLKMRESSGGVEESPVAITPRQLEALVRIAEARARASLSPTVKAIDAEAAIKIMRKSLQDVGAVGEDEQVDIDVIMTGKPVTVREGLTATVRLVIEIEKESGEVEIDTLFRRLETEFRIDRNKAGEFIRRLRNDGTIYSPREGFVKRTR